jgi:hypothetical protein
VCLVVHVVLWQQLIFETAVAIAVAELVGLLQTGPEQHGFLVAQGVPLVSMVGTPNLLERLGYDNSEMIHLNLL